MNQGSSDARTLLIEHNMRLVAHIIKKYAFTDKETDDLLSIGTIGLIKAVNTFDVSRGNRLSSYAAKCIDNEILMLLRAEKKMSREVSLYEPIGTDKEGNPVTGFYAGRTHDIIANTDCALGVPVNKDILEIILAFMKKYKILSYDEKTGKGLIRHALIRYGFTTKEIMVCLVINGTEIPHADDLIKALTKIPGMTSITVSVNTRRTNVIMGDSYEVLWGPGLYHRLYR